MALVDSPVLAEIRRHHPGLMESLHSEFSDYLARSYQDGVFDGFQMALRMAEKVIPTLASEEQRGAITGLVEALRKIPTAATLPDADRCSSL